MVPSDNADIKVTASDALEFEPVAPRAPKRRWGLRLAFGLFVVVGGAGSWQYFGDQIKAIWGGAEAGIPMIRAEPGPIKVRPENPGGLRVPDRDKLVYDRIQREPEGQEAGRGPERLLPPPEQLLPKPTAAKKAPAPPAAKSKTATKKTAAVEAAKIKKKPTPAAKPVATVPTVKDVATAKRPVPPPPAPPAAPKSTSPLLAASKGRSKSPAEASSATAKSPAKTRVEPPTKTAKATPARPPALPPAPAPVPKGSGYQVQLAAARSPEGAKGEWNRLRGKNLDLLGDLGLTITKADLGPARGVFYRLRAGPLADEAAARRLCTRLTKRQVGCLIIKPGQ